MNHIMKEETLKYDLKLILPNNLMETFVILSILHVTDSKLKTAKIKQYECLEIIK